MPRLRDMQCTLPQTPGAWTPRRVPGFPADHYQQESSNPGQRRAAIADALLIKTLPANAECHVFRLLRRDGGALVVVVVIGEAVSHSADRVLVPEL
jgi:hypothetical protein